MNSRLDLLAEDDIAVRIHRLRENLNELKSAAQFIGGDSSVFHRVLTADTWDWTFSGLGGTPVTLQVTFTPDAPSPNKRVNQVIDLELTYTWSGGAEPLLHTERIDQLNGTTVFQALAVGAPGGSVTLRLKFRLVTTAPGVLTFQAL